MQIEVWRRFVMLAIVGIGLTFPSGAYAQAQAWSGYGNVTWLLGGYKLDTLAVGHTAPFVNPGGACQAQNAGYATDPADPGHSLFHTMLLSAYMNGKQVKFLLEGCVFNKPKIIAVEIR